MQKSTCKIVAMICAAAILADCKPRNSSKLRGIDYSEDERALDVFLQRLPPNQRNIFKQDLVVEQLITSVVAIPNVMVEKCAAALKIKNAPTKDDSQSEDEKLCDEFMKRNESMETSPENPETQPDLPELRKLESLMFEVEEPVIRWRLATGYIEIARVFPGNKALNARAVAMGRMALDPRRGIGSKELIKIAPAGSPNTPVFCSTYHECHMYLQYLDLISRIRPEMLSSPADIKDNFNSELTTVLQSGAGTEDLSSESPKASAAPSTSQGFLIREFISSLTKVGVPDHITSDMLWAQARYIGLRAKFFSDVKRFYRDGTALQFYDTASLQAMRGEIVQILEEFQNRRNQRLASFIDENGQLIPNSFSVAKCEIRFVDLKDDDINYDPNAKVDSCNKEELAKDQYIQGVMSEMGRSFSLFRDRLTALQLYLDRVATIDKPNGRVSPYDWFAMIRRRLSSSGSDRITPEAAMLTLLEYYPMFESSLPWRDLWLNEGDYYLSLIQSSGKAKDQMEYYATSLNNLKINLTRIRDSFTVQLQNLNLPTWLNDPRVERLFVEEIPNLPDSPRNQKLKAFATNFNSTQYWLASYGKSVAARAYYIAQINAAANAKKKILSDTQVNDQNLIDGLLQPWGMLMCYSYYGRGLTDFDAKSPLDQGGLGWTGLGVWNAKQVCDFTPEDISNNNSTIGNKIGQKIVFNRNWSNGMYETIGPAVVMSAFTIATSFASLGTMSAWSLGMQRIGLDMALKKISIQSVKWAGSKFAGRTFLRYAMKGIYTGMNYGIMSIPVYFGIALGSSVTSSYLVASMQARELQSADFVKKVAAENINWKGYGKTWLNLFIFGNTDFLLKFYLPSRVYKPIADLPKQVARGKISIETLRRVQNAPQVYGNAIFLLNTVADWSTVQLMIETGSLSVKVFGNIRNGAPWLAGTSQIINDRFVPVFKSMAEGAILAGLMTRSMMRVQTYQAQQSLAMAEAAMQK